MARSRKTMEKWLKEVMNETRRLNGKDINLSMLSLVHLVGQSQREIDTIQLEGGASNWNTSNLQERFQDRAATYSQDMGGTQWFAVLGFYGKEKPDVTFPFKIVVDTEGEVFGTTSEPPNETGKLQQTMRHSDARENRLAADHAMVYRKQERLDDTHAALINDLRAERAALRKENLEAFGMLKELLMAAALNTHEFRLKEIAAEKEAETQGTLLKMVPALANTVTGRNIFPQSTEDTALVEAIADSIDPDMIGILSSVLKPEAYAALVARFEAHQKKRNLEAQERAKAREAAAVVGLRDPLGDVAGQIGNGTDGE